MLADWSSIVTGFVIVWVCLLAYAGYILWSLGHSKSTGKSDRDPS